MNQTANRWLGRNQAPKIYAFGAILVTGIFLVFGLGRATWIPFAIPLICLLLALRWRFFVHLVSISIFACLLTRTFTNVGGVYEETDTALALTAIVAIGAAWRFETSVRPAGSEVTTHVNYVPSRRPTVNPNHLTPGHAISCVLIVVGWLASGLLCKKLIEITADERAYRVYAELLKVRVGLIPEAYLGMRLLFTLALVFWICWTCFSYLQIRQREGSVAAMHLRGELWRWNGGEQRSIAKQLRKNEVAG